VGAGGTPRGQGGVLHRGDLSQTGTPPPDGTQGRVRHGTGWGLAALPNRDLTRLPCPSGDDRVKLTPVVGTKGTAEGARDAPAASGSSGAPWVAAHPRW